MVVLGRDRPAEASSPPIGTQVGSGGKLVDNFRLKGGRVMLVGEGKPNGEDYLFSYFYVL